MSLGEVHWNWAGSQDDVAVLLPLFPGTFRKISQHADLQCLMLIVLK